MNFSYQLDRRSTLTEPKRSQQSPINFNFLPSALSQIFKSSNFVGDNLSKHNLNFGTENFNKKKYSFFGFERKYKAIKTSNNNIPSVINSIKFNDL